MAAHVTATPVSLKEIVDPDRGVPFSSFVRPRVVGAIKNELTKATEARSAYSARKRAERDRLAPELAQKIRQAYQCLTLHHDWPALSEEVELPDGLKSRVAWFFKANARFKGALHTKWRDMACSPVTEKLVE